MWLFLKAQMARLKAQVRPFEFFSRQLLLGSEFLSKKSATFWEHALELS
jgi:hypothetical protein